MDSSGTVDKTVSRTKTSAKIRLLGTGDCGDH
jgi:hypothetical protein